jgi:hypothetical protein
VEACVNLFFVEKIHEIILRISNASCLVKLVLNDYSKNIVLLQVISTSAGPSDKNLSVISIDVPRSSC